MVKLCNQSLLNHEDLTVPSFQVIVMSANMGCVGCRQKVSQVISKLSGLQEYTVDVRNKQVTVKGDFEYKCSNRNDDALQKTTLKKERRLLTVFRATCFRNSVD